MVAPKSSVAIKTKYNYCFYSIVKRKKIFPIGQVNRQLKGFFVWVILAVLTTGFKKFCSKFIAIDCIIKIDNNN